MKTIIRNTIILLALLGSLFQVNASQNFIYQDSVLKGDNGKTAKIFVGVPVTIKKEMGKNVKVSIKGYMFGDEVYSSKTKELLVAKVQKGFNVNKTEKNEVELIGTLSKELTSSDLLDVWGEHEEFYFEMCTQCHAGPEVNHHTMMEWEAVFGTMRGFAKLDEEEASYLLRYLKANASDGFIKVKH
ncbi:molybdopterin-containing oxidoreductase I, DMSO/TMAO/BSO reductase family, monoheme c-type cytochrome [Malaciobacter marinus]|uniref:Molybdopterin-containing oxidoreductase I, DMSO/TMAO/BSO reductase family, monoheme c-type cytochrome n=1 Tax=Malaciobacter marinus TaxID=505249 RepID=A0A347TLY1_9BACT|nr:MULTISPECIES: hypothetical protein [Malaciobacter]AXX87609.1 molybdopterin-containing oxidoreductase I, DMSO/TMAO/BSO reductase family, monoheme c-type cytochrome [Malaciobacter marinus]PHO12192.1 hypothetical protein CPG38_09155 [Malaciobacter marinus]PHO14288.1 hypothetical protein CPH92_12750 [Malaciobacter marinus]RYA24866.1 hypothetical protein CRU96_00105 [Malaciobacter halophilus]